MQDNTKNEFFKDFKKWVLDAPDGVAIIRLYNRGLITIYEALRMVNNSHLENIKPII